MLLSYKKKYSEAIEAIKKDISYVHIELKKKHEKETIFYREQIVKMVSI